MNRVPIRLRIQKVVLLISTAALIITASVGLFSILRLRGQALSSGKKLGDTAAADSGQALLTQMEKSLSDIVSSKARLADAKLEKFSDYVSSFSTYITTLYRDPDTVLPLSVLPPDAANKDVLAMQRNLENTSVAYQDVADEIALLGNVVKIFDPVIRQEASMITTIYLGTESGFLLSYDKYSHTADTGLEEEYYPFFSSSWYRDVKTANRLIFTDTYQDGYGRGLTISCAAPFYRANGDFAGVVCMDILISDLNQNIIDIDLGQDAFAFLVNRTGEIIASPNMDVKTDTFENISDPSSALYSVRDRLLSGETGFVQSDDDVYYAYTPIDVADWTLAIHVPAAQITMPADTIRGTIETNTDETARTMDKQIVLAITIFIAAFILITGIVILLSNRFARKLTKPLAALEDDVTKISSGDLAHQAAVTTNDEIGDLAVAFNTMTGSLRRYIADLTTVTAEKERIGAELNVAKHIQASMLPCIFPAFPERSELDIYATMTPAKEVGGDFYDFFLIDDDHLAMVMADVSGKGVPAALFMVIAKTLLKNCAQTGLSPKAVLEKVNNQLCTGNDAEMFVTVWLGILEISSGHMTCANAGHEYPVIMRAGGDYELIKDKHGFVLAGMEGSRYREYELDVRRGEKLFLYTDGVPEATNAQNELFGTERMLAALNRHKNTTCEALLTAMKDEINAFVGSAPQFDDITMLSLELTPQKGTTMKKITLQPTLDAIEKVTAFVEQELNESDVPKKLIMQMNIAVDEIFSNIIRYSGANDATVGLAVDDNIITLRFADNGCAYNPTEKADPDITLPADERDIGGLGIFMVKKTMDSISYEYLNGLNILTLKKSLSQTPRK